MFDFLINPGGSAITLGSVAGRMSASTLRGRSCLAFLIAGGLLIAACGGGNTGASSPKQIAGGTVTIRMAGDWGRAIDGGHTATGGNGLELAAAMYDMLVYLDVTTGKYAPYIASSWTQTPTSVTAKIRNDATCSDGTKMTPSVVYDSFARYLSPQTKSPWVSSSLGSGPFTISKDEAAGTFTLTSAKPNANLLYGLGGFASSGIICPKGLDPSADFSKASYGSGPYVFKSAVQGSEYVLSKREGWNWGPEGMKSSATGFPDTLDFKVIANESTAANLLVTGGLDIAQISGPDVTRLASDTTLENKLSIAGGPYILSMNESPDRPTSSQVVRKAVATALDPRAWTRAAGEPNAPISTNIQASPGGYCYSDLSALMPKPSVANARQDLTQAGYSAGPDGKLQKDGKPLKMLVVGTNFNGSAAEYLGNTLEQVGITVDLVNTDLNSFSSVYYSKANYDVLIGLFGGSLGVPSNAPLFMIGPPPSQGGNNRLVVNDPQLTALVNAAEGAATESEACQAWKKYNTYVLQNWIAVPWSTGVSHYFSRKGAFAYTPNTLQLLPVTVRRTK